LFPVVVRRLFVGWLRVLARGGPLRLVRSPPDRGQSRAATLARAFGRQQHLLCAAKSPADKRVGCSYLSPAIWPGPRL